MFRPGSMTVTLSGAHPAASLSAASSWRELPGYALTGTARHSPAGQDATLFLSFDRSQPVSQPAAVAPELAAAPQLVSQPAAEPWHVHSSAETPPASCPVRPAASPAAASFAASQPAAAPSAELSPPIQAAVASSLYSSSPATAAGAGSLYGSSPASATAATASNLHGSCPATATTAGTSSLYGSSPPARTASLPGSEAFPDENPSSASTTPRSSLSLGPDSRPASPSAAAYIQAAPPGDSMASKPGSKCSSALSLEGVLAQYKVRPAPLACTRARPIKQWQQSHLHCCVPAGELCTGTGCRPVAPVCVCRYLFAPQLLQHRFAYAL